MFCCLKWSEIFIGRNGRVNWMHFRPQRDLHFYFPNLMSRDKIFEEEKKILTKSNFLRFYPPKWFVWIICSFSEDINFVFCCHKTLSNLWTKVQPVFCFSCSCFIYLFYESKQTKKNQTYTLTKKCREGQFFENILCW
jgi:hypothetical protein